MSEAIFLLAVFILAIEGVYIIRYALQRRSFEITMPILWMCFTVFSVSLIPAFVAIWSGEYSSLSFGFPLNTWTFGIMLEIVFFFFFILGLHYANRRYPIALHRLGGRLRSTLRPWWFVLFTFALVAVVRSQFSGPWTSWRYEAAGLYTWIDLNDPAVTEGGLERFLSIVFVTPALFVLIFAREKPPGIWPRLISIGLFVGFLIPIIASNVAFGARGMVTALVFMLATVWAYDRKCRKAVFLVLVVSLVVTVASSGVRAYRGHSLEYRGLTDWERLQIMVDYVLGGTATVGSEELLESFVLRLDMVQDGGILAEATQRSGDFALYRPFIGSLLGLIPRYFWPEKPIPLSKDNSVLGTPHYLAGALRGMPWNSAGMSASGIAFWQFWWPGVALTGFINGVLLIWLSRMCLRGGLAGLFLFLSVARQLHFLMVTSFDNWILIILKIVLPFLVLHFVYVRFALALGIKPAGVRATGWGV